MERFTPIPRAEARQALGLEQDRRYLLFPADPARPEKRYDLARSRSPCGGVELLDARGTWRPREVPAVGQRRRRRRGTSDREGFGLAVLEALACDVPVLATPVGIHPQALAGVAGTLCAPFSLEGWGSSSPPR